MATKDMKHKRNPATLHGLRQRAEELLRKSGSEVGAMPTDDIQTLVHELQVYQTELEMQNDELQKAQVDLQDARDRYVDLYDSAPVGYLTLDRDTNIEEANMTAATLLKIERRELIGQPLAHFFDAEVSADAIHLHVRETFARGDKQSCELLCTASDGSTFHAQLESCVTRDDDLPRCHTTLSDITDRKRAEGERKQLELLERGRAQILEQVARGESLSDVLLSLTKTIEELLPRLACSVLVLDQRANCLRHGAAPSLPQFYNEAVDGLPIGPAVGSCGTAAHTASRVIAADVMSHPSWAKYRELAEQAGLRACWAEPVLSLDGKVLGTFGMYYREPREPTATELGVIEIAAQLAGIAIEHRQAQDALIEINENLEVLVAERTAEVERASEDQARLAALVESTSAAVIGLQLDGTINAWNPAAERLYGHSAAEAVGHKIQTLLIPPERSHELAEVLSRLEQSEAVQDFETVRLHKDGTPIDVALTMSLLRDKAGRASGLASIVRDLREQKQMEQQMAELADQERQRLGRDLHDTLGQQITAVSMLASALREKFSGELSQAELLAKLETSVEAAKQQLRFVAKGMFPVDVDAHGLSVALADLAQQTSEVHQVDCLFECPQEVPLEDNFTATQMFLVAREAVHNAVKHAQPRNIVIRLNNHDGVRLSVRDDGLGISHDTQDSTGMGLRIMRHRCKLIGGNLAIQSPAEGGTLLTCSLKKESGRDRN